MNKKRPIDIFIVEDNPTFLAALKADIESVFQNANIKVHSFITGEICMEKFRKIVPEVVIVDYHLNSRYPDAADGIKVLDWIKSVNEETYVMMLTSDDHVEVALRSFKHGATDYIVKSETKFKKINNSLFNIFLTMEAKRMARKYKRLKLALAASLGLLAGALIAIKIFSPATLK